MICPEGNDKNFYDQYFDSYILRKNHLVSYFIPNQLKKEFYEEAILLDEEVNED